MKHWESPEARPHRVRKGAIILFIFVLVSFLIRHPCGPGSAGAVGRAQVNEEGAVEEVVAQGKVIKLGCFGHRFHHFIS